MFAAGLAALLVTALRLETSVARPGRCTPRVNTQPFDVYEISQRTWYETWVSPKGQKKCVLRNYDVNRNKLQWLERDSLVGDITDAKTMDFIDHGNLQLLKKDGSLFQQFVATDNETWMLIHVCDRADGVSRWLVAFSEPTGEFPMAVRNSVQAALRKNGVNDASTFALTKCAPPTP